MKSIANIVTNSKKVNFNLSYNKCRDLSEIDESLPTLIIGFENAKKTIRNFNILKKHYPEQNLWWTYGRTERMSDYIDDTRHFENIAIEKITDSVAYSNIDVINESPVRKMRMLRYLMSDDKKIVYSHYGKILFVYSPRYKTVWGLSLLTMRYFGYDPKKMLSFVFKNKNNSYINDLNEIPVSVKRDYRYDIPKQIVLYEYFS